MICPFCKEEIADGAIKCKHCQSMLNGEVPQGADAPAQENTSVVGKAVGFAAALFGGISSLATAVDDEGDEDEVDEEDEN